MPKSKPFTIRLSEVVEDWLERENRRTRLPKSALLENLAEEPYPSFPRPRLQGTRALQESVGDRHRIRCLGDHGAL
jgi:hypothetical protein